MTARLVAGWLILVATVAACGRSRRPTATGASDTAAAAGPTAPAAPGSVTALAAAPVRQAAAAPPPGAAALPPNAFRHEKHRGMTCDRCHTAVPGHTVHRNVACTACHTAVAVTGPIPTAAECAACHHASTQHRACSNCHDATALGVLTLRLDWKLSVWPAARERVVTFDHRWHAGLTCTACHTDRPALVPTRACGSCHVHHEGKADCRTCHQSPPPGVHTAAVHTGCTGSGCHQNPPVTVSTLSRDECLLCHADRVNHQPGRVCATCHMLQPVHGAGRGAPAGSP